MIIIDTREPPNMEEYFTVQGFEVDMKREMLDIGDYLVKVNETVIPIERKSSGDFIASMVDGRLNNQLYAMSKNFPISYVIVVGPISEALDEIRQYAGEDYKVSRKTCLSCLVGLSLKRAPDGERGTVITLTVENEFDFAACVYYIHKKAENGDFDRLPRPIGKKSDFESCLVTMYSTFPGIGLEKAKLLAKHFPSLESIMKAKVEELTRVPGIGEVTAKKIYNFIHGGGDDN